MIPLDSAPGEITPVVIPNFLRLSGWGYGKFEASGPGKPGKIPGESSLSPGDLSLAFTGREASRQASFRRRARSTASKDCLFLSSFSGSKVCFPNVVTSANAGPGASGPWFGSGANSPSVTPCYSLKVFFKSLPYFLHTAKACAPMVRRTSRLQIQALVDLAGL